MHDIFGYFWQWCANLPGRTLQKLAKDMIGHIFGVRSYRRRRRY